jgi:PRTRC genetic system ThiF family protein
MNYTVSLREVGHDPTLVIVGCGGTGGFVADGVNRLLIGHDDIRLVLVDPDIVEPHNLRRQTFYEADVGHFKSQVLAERLSKQYGRPIAYSVMPYEIDMFDDNMGGGMIGKANNLIIIGCTDRASARRSIAESFKGKWVQNFWWLDSGNGRSSGQVLIGNAKDKEGLKESFDINEHTVSKLPIPSLQLPALLIPPTKSERPRDCAEAVEDDEQSPTINQSMATLVLDMVYKLLTNKLNYMGAYLDMDAGTLQYVPATPVTVARMMSMPVAQLMQNKCALGARYHV